MSSRFDNRTPVQNSDELYRELRKKRNVRHIVHWKSPEFKYPSAAEIRDLNVVSRVWGQGDRFFKYASEFYGDPKYWWIIAWFNQKPLESDFKPGDVVNIPLPLRDVLDYFY